jgi:hypothetical protein
VPRHVIWKSAYLPAPHCLMSVLGVCVLQKDLMCLILYAAAFFHMCTHEPYKIAYRTDAWSMAIPNALVFIGALTLMIVAKDK